MILFAYIMDVVPLFHTSNNTALVYTFVQIKMKCIICYLRMQQTLVSKATLSSRER